VTSTTSKEKPWFEAGKASLPFTYVRNVNYRGSNRIGKATVGAVVKELPNLIKLDFSMMQFT
jgi:hypothetical protein